MPSHAPVQLRPARLDDAPGITALIGRSARGLGRSDYHAAQLEAALTGAFGLDTQLIDDGTYFVAEQAGRLVGCGGWSRRRTVFGSDAHAQRDASLLDSTREPARIRAFFVEPDQARRGIGRALLERCEAEARAAGFRSFALMATLPGLRLYAAMRYVAGEPVDHPLGPGLSIRFVPMRRDG
jgi:GNAT superfamily N-acetyltransferase